MIFEKYSNIKKIINDGKISSEELCKSYLERIRTEDPKIKAFLRLDEKYILEQAKKSDQRRKKKKPLSDCDGIPIGIKDNICIQGQTTTCASKILENYKSPYDATVIEKLKENGFVLFPGLNMDEFAMGSSTENSAFQITKNPFDTQRIPGGSSGGSSAAVSASMLPISLGSDTGGSIRQPASLCGVYGLKPTYGTVSRYGLVAYASSLDQIGPISNDIMGIRDVYHAIAGNDPRDSTSLKNIIPKEQKVIKGFKGLKIAIMANEGGDWEKDVQSRFNEVVSFLKSEGAEILELDFSLHEYSIPVYYIIATAECSSNLSRFDGIRYGMRSQSSKKIEEIYTDSRSEGFGKEVKRRILLGTFSLSSGYYDAYYGKALEARHRIRQTYDEFFQKADLILQPTSPVTAFEIGERTKDPIQMYKADIMTTSINLAGVTALSIPAGTDNKGLPIGMQITAPHLQEERLFQFAEEFSKNEKFSILLPKTIQ